MNIYQIHPIHDVLAGNPYVGRGIMIGMTADGKNAAFGYFIMGRSENSRNRIFVREGRGDMKTQAYDESKLKDPSLIIYYPVRDLGSTVIVTNGDQTDTIRDFLMNGSTFDDALDTRCFEPDGPNWTPRISGILFLGNTFKYKMSILKSLDEEGSDCVRETFSYPAKAGLGHFIHTYVTDGNPIPTFVGEPERIAVPNCIDEFTNTIWDNLDEANKISLYTRFINLEDGSVTERLINKHN